MSTVDKNRAEKKKQSRKIQEKGQIDWMITLLPPGMIAVLSILFFLLPEQSNTILAKVRFFWEIPLESIILQLDLVFFCSLCIWRFRNMVRLYWGSRTRNRNIPFLPRDL